MRHFISTKQLGNMSLYTAESKEKVIDNRRQLSLLMETDLENFVFQQQIHGTKCCIISHNEKGKGIYSYSKAISDNDAMISNEKGICLTLMAGDCVPLLFYDPVNKAIGVAHAGWRGTYKKIAQKTIKKMLIVFNSKPSDIIAGIGPSISQEYYEVDNLVYNEFKKHIKSYRKFFIKGKEKDKYYLDLWAANKAQLLELGLKEKNIEIAGLCTYKHNHLFFSARRGETGRFVAGLMIL